MQPDIYLLSPLCQAWWVRCRYSREQVWSESCPQGAYLVIGR